MWSPASLSLGLRSATDVTQAPLHISSLALNVPNGDHEVDEDCMDDTGKAPSTHYSVHVSGFVVVAERITKSQCGKGPNRHNK